MRVRVMSCMSLVKKGAFESIFMHSGKCLYADKLFEKVGLPSAGSWAKQPLHS
jgi:hypothetical protein